MRIHRPLAVGTALCAIGAGALLGGSPGGMRPLAFREVPPPSTSEGRPLGLQLIQGHEVQWMQLYFSDPCATGITGRYAQQGDTLVVALRDTVSQMVVCQALPRPAAYAVPMVPDREAVAVLVTISYAMQDAVGGRLDTLYIGPLEAATPAPLR